MKVAVLETGGKQFIAREGQAIEIDRIQAEVGDPIELKEVLLIVDGPEIRVGRPKVEGAAIDARVVGQLKGPKIVVFKYIPKERYRRRKGHRQMLTRLAIERIRLPGETGEGAAPGALAPAKKASSAAKKAAPKAVKKAVKKAPAKKVPAKKTARK
ncbi:MAG: 50S ribosomal protein L21 [Chloroflexi bacterium RBG_13_66_10]|nr:MAG: 50S ribosomal protein L21 [Chloroflexi bacterium RBG_13_66_10]